jgi:hypothetical protein
MGGTQAFSTISMEVFVKKELVSEVRIFLEFSLVAIHRALPVFVSGKDGDAAKG